MSVVNKRKVNCKKDERINFYVPLETGGLNYFGVGYINDLHCVRIKLNSSENVWREFLHKNITPTIVGIKSTVKSIDNMGNPIKVNDIYECIMGREYFETEGDDTYVQFIPKSFKLIHTLINRYVDIKGMGRDEDDAEEKK